jgi:putative transposase
MWQIDALHMGYPFAGNRMLRDLLVAKGTEIGRLHVSALMKKMAIEAIFRRPTPRSRLQDTRSPLMCCASWR